ncbi:unnamed protein product [Brassica rapa]|uniref:Uncharacterized protein n=1 Tax=Brassica campestris TaxID=3711 RepID=A0A3P6BBF4_BRACM|nr:unnamed protein product [Brassica rapa]VDD03427.1 unnamed protein product [Brassica rapa]
MLHMKLQRPIGAFLGGLQLSSFPNQRTSTSRWSSIYATVTTRPTYWTLNIPLKILEAGVVAVGPKPLSHYFQIQKIEDSFGGYKIWVLHGSRDTPDRYGIPRLQFSFTPHKVVFMRAPETETSSKTMSII